MSAAIDLASRSDVHVIVIKSTNPLHHLPAQVESMVRVLQLISVLVDVMLMS